MPKRALVTGGAGFIGSYLSDALVGAGWQVRILDDLSTGLRTNVPTGAEFINGDILDPNAVAPALDGIEVVFHLAASVSVLFSIEHPEKSFEINAGCMANLLEASRKSGVRKFIYSSSSAAYGNRPESPKSEDLPPMPLSPYAAGKVAGEQIVTSYAHSYGMQTISLRYFNVFGPRQQPDSPYAAAIPIFLAKLSRSEPLVVFGDGEQTRDFTYVDNVVNANLLAADCSGLKGQVVNCACGEETSLNRLIKELEIITGKKLDLRYEPPRVGDVKYSVASIDLAKKLLGYECAVDWKEGLRRTVPAALAGLK